MSHKRCVYTQFGRDCRAHVQSASVFVYASPMPRTRKARVMNEGKARGEAFALTTRL
jgi:hypothetical protein